ncbi:MAG: hypothetical protein ACTJFK_09410, partial [Psychrobacter sp.]
TISEKPIEYEPTTPLWKNPVIIIIILVISVLGALATFKYQIKKADGTKLAVEEVLEQEAIEERQSQDVAIVRVDDDDTDSAEVEKTE